MFLADVAPIPSFSLTREQQLLFVVIAAVGILLCLAAMAFIVFRLLRRRPAAEDDARAELAVDVAALDATPPPAVGPQLEFYGTPVRLAVLVLAPVGRSGVVPTPAQLPLVADYLLPNLAGVLASHGTQYIPWPNQLSTQGFMQAFFNRLALPGDHGKGTPWCCVAGKFDAPGQQYLVGLVCCAAQANSLGEVTVEHSGQWLSVLRVKA